MTPKSDNTSPLTEEINFETFFSKEMSVGRLEDREREIL